MASFFNWADKVKPKTKKIVIGLVMLGLFLTSLPGKESGKIVSALTALPPSRSTATPVELNFHSNISLFPAKIEPSFDCVKAHNGLEQILCSDAELAFLDKQVADNYFTILLKTPKTQSNYLKHDQRDFMKFRIAACHVPAAFPLKSEFPKYITCLKNVYTQRLLAIAPRPAAPIDLRGGKNTEFTTSNPLLESELPWLKEKRLKAEIKHTANNKNLSENLSVNPVLNQNDFNACMDGDQSRCHAKNSNPK